MKPVIIEPTAFGDLAQAFEWYEQQRPGLGDNFFAAFDRTKQQIAERPGSFPVHHRRARRALLDRFPYLVLFIESNDLISVIGVFHTSRSAATIKRRASR